MNINNEGFYVRYQRENRFVSFACTDRESLNALILFLTSRNSDSFPQTEEGLSIVTNMTINPDFHIWGGPR